MAKDNVIKYAGFFKLSPKSLLLSPTNCAIYLHSHKVVEERFSDFHWLFNLEYFDCDFSLKWDEVLNCFLKSVFHHNIQFPWTLLLIFANQTRELIWWLKFPIVQGTLASWDIYQFETSLGLAGARNIIMIHDWAGPYIKTILMTTINCNLCVDFTNCSFYFFLSTYTDKMCHCIVQFICDFRKDVIVDWWKIGICGIFCCIIVV